jgi:meckelin
VRNEGGNQIVCQQCQTGYVQSLDGWSCVACKTNCGSCPSANSFLSDTTLSGIATNRTCITCSANKVATTNGCTTCYASLFTDSTTLDFTTLSCSCAGNQQGGLCLLGVDLSNGPTNFNVPFDANTVPSWYLKANGAAAYAQCRVSTNRNATACQLLGNMCTLLLFNPALNSGVDICKSFYQITSTETSFWPPNTPWLAYTIQYGPYMTNSETLVTISLSSKSNSVAGGQSRCTLNALVFYAAKYSMNGKLISFGPIDLGELQLCNKLASPLGKSLGGTFIGSNYINSCQLPLSYLTTYTSTEPVFYDLYLKYTSSNSSGNLLPVPVVVNNYKDINTGVLINQGPNANVYQMHRRFFLVDRLTAQTVPNSQPLFLRYASSIQIKFSLVTSDNTGRVDPPVVFIDYEHVNLQTAVQTSTVAISFGVQYRMDLSSQTIAAWLSTAVISVVALLWAFIRTWIWNRRSGKLTLDMGTLFKFIVYLCGSVGDVMFIVMFGLSLWWLIFFKGQSLTSIVLPQADQVLTFELLLIISCILKAIDILHLVISQSSFDIFFIDWEKPKAQAGTSL